MGYRICINSSVEYEAVHRLFDCRAPGRCLYCSPGLEVWGLESIKARYLSPHERGCTDRTKGVSVWRQYSYICKSLLDLE